MVNCVYCGLTKNRKSREHTISETVLKELYGKNIENWFSGKKNSQWKWLKNYNNEVIKDVCNVCNLKLSILGVDNAGKQLVKDLNNYHEQSLVKIAFNKATLSWIVKTHLNVLRGDPLFNQKKVKINESIYKSIIKGKVINSNLFLLMIQAANLPSSIWTATKRPSSLQTSLSFINERNILISLIRIRYLFTYIILPVDGTYNTFNLDLNDAKTAVMVFEGGYYAENIDVKSVFKKKVLTINRRLTEDQFISGLINLKEYTEIL